MTGHNNGRTGCRGRAQGQPNDLDIPRVDPPERLVGHQTRRPARQRQGEFRPPQFTTGEARRPGHEKFRQSKRLGQRLGVRALVVPADRLELEPRGNEWVEDFPGR